MEKLNLGIVAHVDAGKTTLTERILFETGVIKRVGSVDHGDTQTDTLEIERSRGITIQSAVVSFRLGELKVNLIDSDENPFAATLGIRIERAEPGSGIRYHWEPGSLPHAFYRATEETVIETLEQGLRGWQVTDCVVTLTDVGYWSPVSIAADFRMLAPLVLMQAL